MEAGGDLVGLSDYVTERTRRRLEDLTDDEYGWEPVPLSWSVRPVTGDRHRADTAPWFYGHQDVVDHLDRRLSGGT